MQAGNAAFQQQRHQQAADEYSRAINMQVEDDAFNAVLYCNRAAAHHAMGRYIDAIADCFTAAALDASYVRVLQRRADAYIAIGDHASAAQVGCCVLVGGMLPASKTSIRQRVSILQKARQLCLTIRS